MAATTQRLRACAIALALALAPFSASAYDKLVFVVRGPDPGLADALKAASLLHAAKGAGAQDPRDVLAAARADYSRILNALYAEGYYGGVIAIRVDGREAAGFSPFAAPARIGTVRVVVEPGPQFRFASAAIGPRAPGSVPGPEFRPGAVARSTAVQGAVAAAVSDWRDAGRAKAGVAGQAFVADHRAATLDAEVRLAPGPLVRFGALRQLTPSAVRAERIARIAGLPQGAVFSPQALEASAERLRRTGAFSSVAMAEAETLGPGNTMDIDLTLADETPRRYGFGAEVSSLEGVTLSGFWMHRNLLGGAERFRLEAEVSNLTDKVTGTIKGIDASLLARLDVPAAFGTDNDGYATLGGFYLDDPAFRLFGAAAEAGVHRRFSPALEAEAGVGFQYLFARDDLGARRFRVLSLPTLVTWDKRDTALDPASGYYLQADVEPFHEFSGGVTGARAVLDARGYFGLSDDTFVLAGRAQAGYVAGVGAAAVPPDDLFFSGGGGTVRGFPYQSLGVDLGGGDVIGGRAFLGGSAELRYRISEKFGAVAFADAGHIGANGFFDGGGGTQVGAGLGLRYYTGLGPVRLDLALPVMGPGGKGAQVYVGIGQAF